MRRWPEACAPTESPRTRGQPETTPREAPRYPDGDGLVHKPGARASALAALVFSHLPCCDVKWSESVTVKGSSLPSGLSSKRVQDRFLLQQWSEIEDMLVERGAADTGITTVE
jgi:hypothetical protein